MSEYSDNVARAMCVLLINEYSHILIDELDKACDTEFDLEKGLY